MSKRTAFGRKLRERRGGATVEFVIWIPFFLALLALITDVSLILNLRSRMQVAAWNSGVAYSRHWKTGPEAETMAEDEFDKDGFGTPVVEATVTADALGQFVTVELTAPYSAGMVFAYDIFENYLLGENTKMTVRFTMPIEPETPEEGEPTGATLD